MTRTIKLAAATALGCALFGAGFAAGRGALGRLGMRGGTAADNSTVVASFAGGSVTASELQAAAAEQGPLLRAGVESAEARHRLVAELARQKLVERAALAKGYDRLPEIVREQRRALAALYVRKEFDEPQARKEVTDDDLRSFLDRHKAEYERPERVRIGDLFLAAPEGGTDRRKRAAEAQALLQKLQQRGAKDYYAFATLARERSDDVASRPFGGDLPVSSRSELAARLGPEVAEAAFALRGGEALVERPVETPHGFHLVRLHAREEASNADLASLRSLLRGRALAERRAKDQEAFYGSLERDGDLRIDDAALAAVPVGGAPSAQR
jgi:peptidyl-prolyl cis-trans isomerase C